MQNISTEQSIESQPGASPSGRSALERELLEEMTGGQLATGWSLKTWHRHSLSLVHLNVLTAWRRGTAFDEAPAEVMDVSDASATGIVDRMEKRGLVERRHGTGDRRVVLVHLTDAGAQVFGDLVALRRTMLSKVLGELSRRR